MVDDGLALSWSGGKDSALAFEALRDEHGVTPAALVTTVTGDYDRVSMHGVRRELIARQAAALGARLVEVTIPAGCTNETYEQRTADAFGSPALRDIDRIAFGDLFLADVRAYRERQMAAADREPLFPLWGRDTATLARHFVDRGFEATLVCVDPRHVDRAFAGRRYDARLLADLPPHADPCGENGEFHTFVHGGPIFGHPVACAVGDVVERDGFVFCDVLER